MQRLVDEELEELYLLLTLYCPPPIGPLRIRRNDFNYSSLGERKVSHSLDNFLQLLEQLVDFFPDAWNRAKIAEFLNDLDPKPIFYFKREEVQNFDRWMMQWVRLAGESTASGDADSE